MATTHSQQIVQKRWNDCNLLRDDGLSYGEQLKATVETGQWRIEALRQAFSGRLITSAAGTM